MTFTPSLIVQLTSKRRAIRSGPRKGEISEKERSRMGDLADAVAGAVVVQDEAVDAVVAADVAVDVDLAARGLPPDSPAGFLLCPIKRGGDIRTLVQ